ncbi:MAG: hypothetical protein A3J48_02655 [Candidatus Doudnabacteria bacterium RIFCSPHIGHO2_02_FULL_46_11]|uniref:Peptidoglycan binding domain-containing protein n=1 Tax=Candidatus Doudnabacteria bacterium RIFCSPHIGHO2_02_FULL_46_11 TaxID=1817832 RepID=A0A1F5P856_9BACT|nr:MAG: hypothetical protein A3J48_02655 [Candidatus Doudnabacteria bacterium RIFCSPHIGHO2_02_FULL_46_11]
MKIYLKIFLLILIGSLFLQPGPANGQSAATSLELILPENHTPKIESQTWPLSAETLKSAQALNGLNLNPKFIYNFGTSLNEYLANRTTKEMPFTSGQKTAYLNFAEHIYNQTLSQLETREPQDALWEEKDGRVVNFDPGTPGIAYDNLKLIKNILKAVALDEKQATLQPVLLPASKTLAEVNPYGIKELFTTGTSNFRGSSRNRIQNITVGASRYHGIIIQPDTIFSFNDLLGEVDGEHGFAPEMVIKYNGVFPEFGGGICQVSTTMFRAALNAGFPFLERRNHSFAVSYYAPQGTDATTYTGVIDLKYKNDSGAPIMIWSNISGTILTFDFYGQKDGRTVELASPVQYDHRPTGAFKTSLKRIVTTASGQSKEDNFISNYRPRAEFVQTTTAEEPVPTPTTPAEQPSSPPNETPTEQQS